MKLGIKDVFKKNDRYEHVRPIHIYLLRLVYILMFFVLGKDVWTKIFTHLGPWEPLNAMVWCVWTAFATVAGVGIFHPLKMIPILLIEIFYKVLWLIIVTYPLLLTSKLAGSPAEDMTSAFLWVLLPICAVPWGYVFSSYFCRHRG
ncbi:hypothetical protein ACO0K0_19895 [Undibacterium sp. SXout11W]|uniref:hypothetical protein n=1 Tax=Undibacterium sp. SXout11W TaxID=3413050 RepID=UPI003BF4521E